MATLSAADGALPPPEPSLNANNFFSDQEPLQKPPPRLNANPSSRQTF